MRVETSEYGIPYPVYNGKLPESLLETADKVFDIIVVNSVSTDMRIKTQLMTHMGLTMGETNRILDAKPEDFEEVLLEIFGE